MAPSHLAIIPLPKPNQEKVMPDFELVFKKRIKRMKYSRVIKILKEFVRAIMITKLILDLKINLIVKKLLASVFAIKK